MKKFILSSVVLLLFILISGCDKNDKNVEFSVYEFYFELVDENGNPFIDNMDDMETLADKMELKWLNPETSKYVECDYFDLKWGYMEDGHYYFSVNSTDVIGDGDDRTASFSFDLVCEDIFSEPVNIKTEWITSLPTYKLYYPLDKIYVNDVKAEVTNIDRGTITVPSVQTIYITSIQIKVDTVKN